MTNNFTECQKSRVSPAHSLTGVGAAALDDSSSPSMSLEASPDPLTSHSHSNSTPSPLPHTTPSPQPPHGKHSVRNIRDKYFGIEIARKSLNRYFSQHQECIGILPTFRRA